MKTLILLMLLSINVAYAEIIWVCPIDGRPCEPVIVIK